MNPKKIHLSVPYRERDQAKALGAHWDASEISWYITADMDITLFQRWIRSPRVTRLRIKAAYLLTQKVCCPRCQERTKVYCIAVKEFTESRQHNVHVGFFTLFNIHAVPHEFYQRLQLSYPTYFMDGEGPHAVLSNHCLCGTVIEDKQLHRLGRHSFRPHDKEHLHTIQCASLHLPVEGYWQCQWRSNPLLLPLAIP